MSESAHNGASLPAMPAPAPERVAVPDDLVVRLAALVAMARERARTGIATDEVELIRRNIEKLLLGGQAFGQRSVSGSNQ